MAKPSEQRLGAQLEHPERVGGNVGHAGSGIGPENAPHYEDHSDDHTHHVSMASYYKVFAFLMIALLATVGAAQVDLGKLNIPIALAIALAKAFAIVTIFMHAKFSSRLVQIFVCTGPIFVAIMFLLAFNDYGTRAWLPIPGQ